MDRKSLNGEERMSEKDAHCIIVVETLITKNVNITFSIAVKITAYAIRLWINL